MKTLFAVVFVWGQIAALGLGDAEAPKADLEPLFLEAPRMLLAQARPAEAHAKRSRVVELNPRLLQPGRGSLQQSGTRIAANLFPDHEWIAVVDQVEIKGPGEFVCIGRVEGVRTVL